ncbi:transmembrane protein 154 isoform 1-T1 [Discoglossus pictus]
MQMYRCALSFALLLAAVVLPSYGTQTPSELDEVSGNDALTHIPFMETSITQSTIRSETDIPGESTLPSTRSPFVTDVTEQNGEDNDLNTTTLTYSDALEATSMDMMSILLYVMPVLILLLLVPLIIFFVKRHRRKKHDEDTVSSNGHSIQETTGNEDVKSPIFEEDTPSVMEIEMEELDKWMSNIKKNGKRLSTLEEERKLPLSDSESL